jgi:hypothetical protein
MNEEEARQILGTAIRDNDSISSMGDYMAWEPTDGENVMLDGGFTVRELEALTWWMRNKIRP